MFTPSVPVKVTVVTPLLNTTTKLVLPAGIPVTVPIEAPDKIKPQVDTPQLSLIALGMIYSPAHIVVSTFKVWLPGLLNTGA